ncbi:MAG: ABC transporter ATP-binding protein [Gammaproteobacteria bacterium]
MTTAENPAEVPVIASVNGLIKTFGHTYALDKVDLDLERGHIIGLVGPNSAGKSTLLRHLVGIYLPTRGNVEVFGIDAARLSDRELARIGYLHQEGQLLDWLSTEDLIRYVAAHYERWNADLEHRLVTTFELDRRARVGVLSPGQRQKLAILLAVCFEPELLLLDEPASALDPIARRHFLELLLDIIQDQNRTILISSHILSDIEKVIDHVIVMDQGRILRDCGFDDLLEEYVKLEIRSLNGSLPDPLPLPGVLATERGDKQAIVIARRSSADWSDIAATFNSRIDPRPLSLEEIYPIVLRERAR